MKIRRIVALLIALALTAGLSATALAVDPQKGNTINPMYAGDANIMAAARATDFWAIDAYENRLDDEITIATGGSYFVGFRTNIAMDNPYLFWNVGWNLGSLTSISYENQIPAAENNFVGGIHIDANASAGQTVYLDFYICPKNTAYTPPVNWGTMTADYVIKKIIKINIVGGQNTASGAEGTAAFAKPIPEGYTLSVADGAADPNYVQPGGATSKAVDLTVKTAEDADYPITKNPMTVSVDLPTELVGKASYVAKYVNPYTGAVETHPATVQNNTVQFGTDHLSTYVIEGYGSAADALDRNEELPVPKTGDTTPIMPLLGLILLAGMGLAGVSRWRKRDALKRK